MMRPALRPDNRILPLQTDVDLLERQTMVYSIIDMGADNYTMTESQCSSSIWLFTNVGTLKKATIPAAFFGIVPHRVFVGTMYASDAFTLKLEASIEIVLASLQLFDIFILGESGLLSKYADIITP